MCTDRVMEKEQKSVIGHLNEGRGGGTWAHFGGGQAGSKEHGKGSCVWE